MEDDLNQYRHLLAEISDDELASLECPTFESQETAWQHALKKVTRSNVEVLLKSIGFDLIDFEPFKHAKGAMQKLFLIKTIESDCGHQHQQIELVLRVYNPHPFLESRHCQNEVAIMSHLKKFTHIPVPEIYAFSYDKSQSVLGCEFVLMTRISGIPLGDLTAESKNIDCVSDKIIDQIMVFVKELAEIRPQNMDTHKIGSFDIDMNIVGPHYSKQASVTFFDYLNSQLQWSAKEIHKIKRYAHLADELDKIRHDLSLIVHENSCLDNLNFGDRMGVYHGDLHCFNILIDPVSQEITGLIDWDFCVHGFEFVQMEISFFKDWFGDEEAGKAMMSRVEAFKSTAKTELMCCFERSRKGKELRSLLYELGAKAYLMVFYCSSWLVGEQEPSLSVRALIEQRSVILKEALDKMPELMNNLRNFISII